MTLVTSDPINSSNKNSCYLFATANSKESTAWKFHLIDHAKESIEFSPNFCGGLDFQVCLLKIRENLHFNATKVHIIASKDFITGENSTLITDITKEFPDRFFFLITDRILQGFPLATIENHEKLLIVDEKYFVIGGSGITPSMSEIGDQAPAEPEIDHWKDRFVASGFRDMDAVGKGPIAVAFRTHFFSLFLKWETLVTGNGINRHFDINPQNTCTISILDEDFFKGCIQPSPTFAQVKALYSKPKDNPKHNEITTEICNQINSTQNNIRIAHMLFNPAEPIKIAIKQLKENRPFVTISLVTNSLNSDSPMANESFVWSNRSNYNLVSEVFEYIVPKILYHKKVMTFDDRITIIGSYNLGQKSALFDDEAAIVVDSPEFTIAVNRIIDSDKLHSIAIDPQTADEFQSLVPKIAAELQQALLGSFLG